MRYQQKFEAACTQLPLVAILRGLHPDEAAAMGATLVDAGWTMIEVPLNSPRPFDSISALVSAVPGALVGAGTVLTADEVRQVRSAGGQMVVSPNFNAEVVLESVRLGMVSLPGVITPTEAFAALAAGASGLKLFPAEMISPLVLKAMRAVLPPQTLTLPVGGVGVHNMAEWRQAGAGGFGIGSALFKPGMSIAEVQEKAEQFVDAWRNLRRA